MRQPPKFDSITPWGVSPFPSMHKFGGTCPSQPAFVPYPVLVVAVFLKTPFGAKSP